MRKGLDIIDRRDANDVFRVEITFSSGVQTTMYQQR